MPNVIRCVMCGSFVVKGMCNECGMPFCGDHLYRHRNCQQGR